MLTLTKGHPSLESMEWCFAVPRRQTGFHNPQDGVAQGTERPNLQVDPNLKENFVNFVCLSLGHLDHKHFFNVNIFISINYYTYTYIIQHILPKNAIVLFF